MRICTIDGCDRKYFSNGLCRKHHNAAWVAANPEKKRAQELRWKQANKPKVCAYKKKWRDANPDKSASAIAAWGKAHPEQKRSHLANYRARKRISGGSHSGAEVKRLFTLQRGCCAVCKNKLADDYHKDHIYPVYLNGTNDIKNIQLLCPQCNWAKSAKHPIDFMQQQGYLL